MFEDLTGKLDDIFRKLRGKGKLSEENIKETLREVRRALLEADVNYKVARDFVERVKEKAIGQDVLKSLTPGQVVVKVVHDELRELLGGSRRRWRGPTRGRPSSWWSGCRARARPRSAASWPSA